MCEFSEQIDNEYSYQLLGTTFDHIIDEWYDIMNCVITRHKRQALKALIDRCSKSKQSNSVSFLEDLFQKCSDELPKIRIDLEKKIKEEFHIPKNVVLKEDLIQIEKNKESVSNEEVEALISRLAEIKSSALAYQKMTEQLVALKQQQKNLIRKLSEQNLKSLNKDLYGVDVFKDLITKLYDV